ncbi:hypothetical protein ACFL6X_08745 [Candidatus Latescibacterota bacterium]
MVESQSLRSLKRYLDYDKRVRAGAGLDDLLRWVGKILLDDGEVYSLEDKALALEIGACESIIATWLEFEETPAATVAVAGPVDRLYLYRQLLAPENDPPRKAAFADLLNRGYRRHWSWLRERSLRVGEEGPAPASDADGHFRQFVQHLGALEPLDLGAAGAGPREAELRFELDQRQQELVRLREYMEAARDRAEEAHLRLRDMEEEARTLRRALREESDAADKLRAERTRRIKADREAAEASRQLERLRAEYIKLDRRLHDMAQRVAGEGQVPGPALDVSQLRQLPADRVLGLRGEASEEQIGQARRRFAAAFHSDRTGHLPTWVGELFDQLMSVVNDACDRIKRR